APERHMARLLEARAARDRRALEVVAMGISGYGQSHELATYEAPGRARAPALRAPPRDRLLLPERHLEQPGRSRRGRRALAVRAGSGRPAGLERLARDPRAHHAGPV